MSDNDPDEKVPSIYVSSTCIPDKPDRRLSIIEAATVTAKKISDFRRSIRLSSKSIYIPPTNKSVPNLSNYDTDCKPKRRFSVRFSSILKTKECIGLRSGRSGSFGNCNWKSKNVSKSAFNEVNKIDNDNENGDEDDMFTPLRCTNRRKSCGIIPEDCDIDMEALANKRQSLLSLVPLKRRGYISESYCRVSDVDRSNDNITSTFCDVNTAHKRTKKINKIKDDLRKIQDDLCSLERMEYHVSIV